jgi:signal transduction histidine kinase
MQSMAGSVGHEAGSALARLLVFEDTPQHGAEVAGLLKAHGYRTTALAGSASEAVEALARDRPGALIVVDRDGGPGPGSGPALRAAAAEQGIPILVVVDDLTDPGTLADRLADADDWVSLGGLATELPIRVARLIRRGAPAGTAARGPSGSRSEWRPLALSPRFLSLVVHDLRTPLNVISLSLRMINQAVPRDDPELEEDLRFVDENLKQIERMLAQLSDYYRLHDREGALNATEFSPRRLVDELLEARRPKAEARSGPVSVEVAASCPAEVALDPTRARMAIHYAVTNAAAAANGDPVRVVLRGGPDRWVIEVVVDQPPPETVTPTVLSPVGFERLCGVAAERRGMDLAIAAKVSELFGGTARLDVGPGDKSAVVLEWPARLPAV